MNKREYQSILGDLICQRDKTWERIALIKDEKERDFAFIEFNMTSLVMAKIREVGGVIAQLSMQGDFIMSETHLICEGDRVRAYYSEDSEYYIEGVVESYNDDTEEYLIRYHDRGDNPDRILKTSADLVELV